MMDTIQAKDRERLRALARKQLEYANSPRNEDIMQQWLALGEGRREKPTIRLLFSNFNHEVITPRMECEGEAARGLEWALLGQLVGRELFDDDTPIDPYYAIQWHTYASPFGIQNRITRPNMEHPQGFHIDPVITDLKEQIELLRGGSFGVDREATQAQQALAEDVFGDILPTKLVMGSINSGALTSPIVHLMGMENFYCSLYDCPEAVHQAMEIACSLYEQYYDFLEKEKLLLPTCGTAPIAQESFAFNHELPAKNVTSTAQVWGFLESQETTAVSPKTYGEFVYPYQDRLAKRFGLLSYGCCERVDALWPDYLSKWTNLRKLSVSPFNNEARIGEYLRGSQVIYYSKPRADFVTRRGSMDEDALREYFKEVAENASGCLLEVAQREVGTIYGDYERGRRYVQIARETIDQYWKP